MRSLYNKFREWLYNTSLTVGLFYFLPFVVVLPGPVSTMLIRLKAWLRYYFGTYRAYVNRPKIRDIAIENMMHTLGVDREEASKRIKRLMYLEVMAEADGWLLDKYNISSLEKRFSIQNIDNLNKELLRRKGIIFATIHSGDTVLFMLYLALMGYNIYGLFDRAIEDEGLNSPLIRFARVKDSKITGKIGKLYAGQRITELVGVLKKNGIVVWMIDLPPASPKRSNTVRFLDRNLCINNSFWELTEKTGASLLPHISVFNHKNDIYDVIIGEPVKLSDSNIQRLFDFFEPYVREHPESWIGWYILDWLKCNEEVAQDIQEY